MPFYQQSFWELEIHTLIIFIILIILIYLYHYSYENYRETLR